MNSEPQLRKLASACDFNQSRRGWWHMWTMRGRNALRAGLSFRVLTANV